MIPVVLTPQHADTFEGKLLGRPTSDPEVPRGCGGPGKAREIGVAATTFGASSSWDWTSRRAPLGQVSITPSS